MEPGTVIPMVRCEHNPELMASINGLRAENAALKQHVSALLMLARWGHSVCDDPWYSCPASGENPREQDKRCDCGADTHNAKVNAIAQALGLETPDGQA